LDTVDRRSKAKQSKAKQSKAKQRSNIAFEEMKESLINSGLDEQSAKDNPYSNILPELQKELENIYMERLV
jgi:hypothetical protein